MIPFEGNLDGDAYFIYQQDLAPAQTIEVLKMDMSL